MTEPTYKALLIGNSTFPNDPHNLQALEGPVNDISLLRDALTDPGVGLFESGAVRLLPERTMSEILIELETFFGSANRDDRLLLYYSGHGLLTEDNRLLLCARDTRTDLVRATSVSATAINELIEGSSAQTTVIVLDCCYSGAFKGANLPDSLKGNGRFLLTSCRSGQLANDATRKNSTSVFTQHLVDALVNAVPDGDGDGYVELSEIYDYVHARLLSEGRQIPQRNFAGGGGVAIARRPRQLPDQALPPSDFELSTASLDLDDVEPGEVLPPEQVYVLTATGRVIDLSVHTEADWLEVEPHDGYFTIVLRPGPGTNRANVVVRDLVSGVTRTLRVRVRVRGGDTAAGPATVPGTPEAARPAEPEREPAAPAVRQSLLARARQRGRGRKLTLAGVIGTVALAVILAVAFAGNPFGSSSAPTPEVTLGPADLLEPTGLAVDSSGAIYVADFGHGRVRRIGPDGNVTTVAGRDEDAPSTEGAPGRATSAPIETPLAVAIDSARNLYIASRDQGGILKVTPDGAISPVLIPGAESPKVSAIAVTPDDALLIATGNTVLKVGRDGSLTPVAGSGIGGYTGDGGPALAARLNSPTGLAVDRDGAVYIADNGNHAVRVVRPGGTIITIAGTGTEASSGDGGLATAADVAAPVGVTVDNVGNLYISTANQLRGVGPDGRITGIAGQSDGSSGFSGDGGPASAALLNGVVASVKDAAGNIYVSDSGNNRLRKISTDGIITTVG